MKVLFASSLRGWGGGEEWFVRASRALLERGHDVRLAPRRGSELARRGRSAGLSVHEIDYGGLLDPRAPLQLAALLTEQHTEVAVANLDKELAALSLARVARPGLVLVVRRGSDFPVKATGTGKWLHSRGVSRVIVNSTGIADTLAEGPFPVPRAHIDLLPNGLDPLASDPEDALRRAADWPPGSGPRLVAVGELSSRKNPHAVLEALAEIEKPWRLLWIGSGPLRREIEARIESPPWAGRVRLLGERPEARRWTRAADALVHFSSSEGQPWAVLEALVEGVPVVVSRMPGLDGLVQEGAGAWIAEPGDAASLARALARLLEDPEAARRGAEAASARVRPLLAEDPVYDRLERLLEAARAEAHPHRRAVFLDRDGTLTPEMGALSRADAVRLLPGVASALRALSRGGYALVVVTNQAAIGRGLVRASDVRAVNAALRRRLRAEGVELAGVYVCPHRPEDECACRKPAPGMVLDSARVLSLSLADSWMIGDSTRDVEMAARAGLRAILVDTGWAGQDPSAPPLDSAIEKPTRAADLPAAARLILRQGG